jgi:competence protein ComEC
LGIFLGIIIGEPGYLDPDERDAFMATGTVHILSISGSHLGLIAFLTFVLVKGLCRCLPMLWLERLSRRITPSRLAVLVTIVMVTFYCLLAGVEVATVRSWVMILVFLLAVWSGRQQHLLLALAGAALLILCHDPRALYDISFQLSYLSVLAIALVLHWRGPQADAAELPIDWFERLRRWLRDYFLITGAVTLATVPLVAYYFNQVPWLGVVANLLVVPLAGLVLVPLGLGAAVWLLLIGGDTLPGGPHQQALLDAFSGLVHVFASVPGAAWHVASPALFSLALFYGCLFFGWRPRVAVAVRAGCLVAAVLLLGWWALSPRPAWNGTTLRVTFLDVGQGDASLIELPDGQTVLIDAGASYDTLDLGRAVVGPFLWDRGIRRLDHVIGTHPQLDHVGGLAWIIRRFDIGRYWSNGVRREEPFYQRLARALDERGISEQVAITGNEIASAGPCRLRVLSPDRVASEIAPRWAESGSAMNNLSVVTRLDCGLHSVLFAADVETDTLGRLSRNTAPIRVLKVPHHGARSSLDRTWIARVRPEAAVFSAGRYNAYGHPAPSVVEAYEEIGTRIFRTDRQGAIWMTARLSESALELHSAAESVLIPVRIGAGAAEQERGNLGRLASRWRES